MARPPEERTLRAEIRRRNQAESAKPKPTPSTVGSKKMYRNGQLVDKGQYSQDAQSFKPRPAPRQGVDPNRELYKKSIKTGKSGTN